MFSQEITKKIAQKFDSSVISACTLQAKSLVPFDLSQYAVLPGFCDVHVHFREPGFSYKETILSGSQAAAAGGYTAVCTMPNLSPVPDSIEHLNEQLDIIERDAVIHVYPYASITVSQAGEKLSDLEGMAEKAIAFSDDGRGVQQNDMMREAMLRAKALDKMIVAHCEVNSLLFGGYIHDGQYAKTHGHRGICSESEYKQIERDLKLALEIGCKYHVCHISTKESVQLIREAKARGVNVTCETGPHYLVLDDSCLKEDGKYKMNPPLRDKQDRLALVEGICDGTIDMIATDHAPHSAEEKSRGLEKSAFGIVGIETAFPVMYTKLVKTGIISMEKLVELMVINPRKRFDIPLGADFSVWDLESEYTVDPNKFLSKGKATPFEGEKLFGECLLTVCDGKIVYNKKDFE
ncbi:MAG: dihydroorotase [Oscillospiraceae bacterium]|nr:dihydroorotase [Oscillospiraceae bacterium]